MSLESIRTAITLRNSQSVEAWVADEELRGRKVKLFREYVDGDHRANLTTEMRKMLRLGSTSDPTGFEIGDGNTLSEFNDNLCPVIVNTMLDRITLTGVTADTPTASDWIAALMNDNRLDALQIDVHEATIRDGNSYVMVDAETVNAGTAGEQRRVRFTHEPAYDGSTGVAVIYETTSSKTPMMAIRIWNVTSEEVADTVRVNVYYADRIERFQASEGGGGIRRYADENDGDLPALMRDGRVREPGVIPWLMRDGTPIGVPFVQFRNKGSSFSNYAVSEIEDVIPLQDVLNRTMYSMVANAELSAFKIRGLIGASAPGGITPGLMLSFYAKDASGAVKAPSEAEQRWLDSIRFLEWSADSLQQFIDQANWAKDQAYSITSTPSDDAGSTISGESLKQRDVKLIGKVQRFETKNGNAWEDAVTLAARVALAFDANPPGQTTVPDFETLTANWRDPEIRNKSQIVTDAVSLHEKGIFDLKTTLEEIRDVYDFSDERIDEIVARVEAEKASAAQQAQSATPQDPNAANDSAAMRELMDRLVPPPAGVVAQNGNGAAEPAAVTP